MNRNRVTAALAGHRGDETTARRLLGDPSGAVRATALGALVRLRAVTAGDVRVAITDPDAAVRRRACAAAISLDEDPGLGALLHDSEPSVVEAAAWTLGERGSDSHAETEALAEVASNHADPLCREAAVAALGAIGDRRGLTAILDAAASDKPAVRRRAVIALAPFDGPDVDAALRAALQDRDWQVRQAAEDLLSEGS